VSRNIDTYCLLVSPVSTPTTKAEREKIAQLLRDFADHLVSHGFNHSHFECAAGEIQLLI
jgi:hypothetical protein